MDMSKRDIELAAKAGTPIDANKQMEYVNKIREENRMRAEEIKREAEEREKEKKETLEEEVIIPKRARRMNELNSNKESISTIATEEADSVKEDVMKDLSNSKTASVKTDVHRPFAKGKKKVKITEIPSYFLSYPKDAEIYITPYNADDIDELSNSNLSLKYILTKCLEGVYTNFDKNKITFYDALYLSYYRRVLSIDDNIITVISTCPYCNKASSREIDINKEIEFEESKIPALPINIDFSFGRLSFTYLTYGDFMNLATQMNSEELAYQCTSEIQYDSKNERREDVLKEMFGNCTGEDMALLKEVTRLTWHGIKPVNTLCQNSECGKTFETMINEWDAIIIPFRRSKESIRNKVSFG